MAFKVESVLLRIVVRTQMKYEVFICENRKVVENTDA